MTLGIREPGAGSRLALVIMLVCVSPAFASQHEAHQTQGAPIPDPGSRIPSVSGVEPIRCWRQASAGAVAIGEAFTVVLTCAVYESESAQVVPDEARLGVASIQMAPFEILGGSHPPDVRRGSRRFFQYDYQLRIISPDAIGRDVNVPALTISYRLHSRVDASAKLEGRDLSYLLPALPIKVLSLVPADADDIRDGGDASLAAVDALRSRAGLFDALALALGALAAVMVILALVPMARASRAPGGAGRDRLPDRAILARVAEELTAIQARVAREGWTDDTVSAALSAVRLVAAAALERPISQRELPAGDDVPEGRLLVSHGLVTARKATVSSAVTSDEVGRAASKAGDAMTVTRGHQLEGLQSGLYDLTAALYRQSPVRDAATLDEALRHALSVAREIAAERSFWKTQWARR
jgi:hypothetical protein